MRPIPQLELTSSSSSYIVLKIAFIYIYIFLHVSIKYQGQINRMAANIVNAMCSSVHHGKSDREDS